MDDISLNSSSPRNPSKSSLLRGSSSGGGGSGSSSVSVSSKFSRKSSSMKHSELAVPLAPSSSYEEHEGSSSPIISGTMNNKSASPSKSYISEDDPFHLFRTDLISKLSQVNSQLHTYLTLISTTDTAVNIHAIRDSKKQLKHSIKISESTLRDLETTVRVVDKSRYKFPHISDFELNERKNFVEKTKDTLVETKLRMQSEDVKQKIVEDERALTLRRGGGGGGSTGSHSNQNNTNNYNYHDDLPPNGSNKTNHNHDHDDPLRSETLSMMKQQDETLDDLDLAVTRVSYIADTIHEELESQNVMLDNLGEDLSHAEEQMGVVMGKLGKLLKTKSKCQIGLILILSVIVLVLFFLVLYT